MRRTYRILSAVALLVVVGACGSTADTPFTPDVQPSLNGGYTTGGNRADDDTQDTGDTLGSGDTTVQSDTVGRNGGYATGGN